MSNISLFDPSSQLWYHRLATGDVPTQRDKFCVVGITAGDNSTYGMRPILWSQMLIITLYIPEIFPYGGQVGAVSLDGLSSLQNINAEFDEVYVLFLPSFVWFKANYTSSDPRIQYTCNIVGKRQMLSIGGLNPSAASLSAAYNDTDPYWEGMKVFDLTNMQWTNYFNANAAPYVAPSAVAAHYAAGSRYPSTWSSSDLESLFVKPNPNFVYANRTSCIGLAAARDPDNNEPQSCSDWRRSRWCCRTRTCGPRTLSSRPQASE